MKKKNKIIFNIIMVVAIVLLTIATVPKTLQEDTYYMIAVGRNICENGMGIINDRVEAFGWVPGLIYTYPHWLLDVIFYQLYNAFGFGGIYAFTLAVGIIIYILIYYTNVKVCKNHLVSAIITLMSIYFLRGFIAARAQIITFFCLVLEMLFIERYLETGKKRYLIGLILDPILLANCHAALFPIYFVIFLPYLAEYILALLRKQEVYTRRIKRLEKKIVKEEELVSLEEKDTKEFIKYSKKLEKTQAKLAKTQEKLAFANKKAEKKKEINGKDQKIILEKNDRMKWLTLTFVICIFTGLITPIKDIPYTYMYKSVVGNTMHFIAEHQAVTLIHDYSLLLMFIVAIIVCFSNKIKMKVRDVFMLGGMTVLSLIAYKQFPIYFICTMCIFNKLIIMLRDTNKARKQKLKEELGIAEENENSEEETEQKEAEVLEESKDKKALTLEDIEKDDKETENEDSEESEDISEDEDNEEDEDEDEQEAPKKKRRKIFSKKFIVSKIKNLPKKILTVKGAIYTILLIAIFSILQYRSVIMQDYVDKKSYPVEASKWINENLDVKNMRLFNDFNYGSYLLFQGIPVFIDGRADCYDPVFNGRSDDSFLAYMLASSLQTPYKNVVEDYDITHIMTTASSTLNLLLEKDEDYKEIYNDGIFVIYDTKPEKEDNKK